MLRGGDEALREEILASLRALVGYVRQHMRRFLPDLTQLVHEFWPAAPRTCLALIADLGMALRDDIRCVRVWSSRGRGRGGVCARARAEEGERRVCARAGCVPRWGGVRLGGVGCAGAAG